MNEAAERRGRETIAVFTKDFSYTGKFLKGFNRLNTTIWVETFGMLWAHGRFIVCLGIFSLRNILCNSLSPNGLWC